MSKKVWMMHTIKQCNKDHGWHFFDPDTMRFFRSRVGNEVFQGPGGVYFVTSEQFVDPWSRIKDRRKYSVSKLNTRNCSVDRVGEFQEFKTLAAAKAVAKKMAAKR